MTNFKHINKEYLNMVELKIDEALDKTPKTMRPMTDHLKNAKGKNIRAAVIIATSQALCGGNISESIVDFAAATELLHLSTLIHDDIIDQAVMRRGIETLQHKFGKKLAVLSGDYLFTKCFRLIAEKNKGRSEEFAKAVSAICVGEILQNRNNKNFDITRNQYYKIIAGKTAAMFVMAMYGAAIESEASQITAERLARAGYYLGMVFQMIDDLLDFEGEVIKTRKIVLKDLDQGIVTYPLIHAISENPALKKMLKKKSLTEKDIEYVVGQIRESGGMDSARRQAQIFYDRAKAKINKALLGKRTDGLIEVLDLIYNRES